MALDEDAAWSRSQMRTIGRLSCALAALLCFSEAAKALCVKHVGGFSDRSLAVASDAALAAWVAAAQTRGPDFGNWAKARHMEVTCRKVIAGSGPRRGPRWVCEASGSTSDVIGGEDCPR
jgi:hypothetical protein